MNATRIVFMGSPEFAAPILHALAEAYPVVGVVTQPDRPSGRGRTLTEPPVKLAAQQLGLPLIQPTKLRQPEAMAQLRDWAPELIVVAAFGQILRQDVLELPAFGCINVHASLLPRWRGAAPIQAAILHGDPQSGVTIMCMDAGVDTGALLSQAQEKITPADTAASLSARLAVLGTKLLIDTLPRYLNGEVQPQPQPELGVTYAPMLKKEDGLLDFSQPAESLARRVQAFNPWPGTFFLWQAEPLKIHRASAIAGLLAEGKRSTRGGLPVIGTADGLLVLEEVQPAGKKAMPGKVFLQGARHWIE
jgi:methionyl-tRNA formyltransferase